MENKIGKNQSYSRVLNNELVIQLLQQRSYSATELADKLCLSNATMSSIAKKLLQENLIKVEKTESIKGCGRKQVLYTLNENYGLFLTVNISNYQAIISIANLKEEILESETLDVEKYDAATIYLILLRTTKILMDDKYRNLSLKNIVISLPGRVNSVTGELMLSKQFDPELFKEQNFIRNVFSKQYPNVPITIENDINVSTSAELKKGNLKDANNAIYISIDTGIGGALVINHKLFKGDQGYSGEFGLLKSNHNGKVDFLDEFVSFRVLMDKTEELLNEKLGHSRSRLIELFYENEKVKDIVLESARILGRTINTLIEVLDISRVVIGGRAAEFGDEYLKEVIGQIDNTLFEPQITFSSLGRNAKQIGSASIGVDYILKQCAKGE